LFAEGDKNKTDQPRRRRGTGLSVVRDPKNGSPKRNEVKLRQPGKKPTTPAAIRDSTFKH
jgi:hypothetical protein